MIVLLLWLCIIIHLLYKAFNPKCDMEQICPLERYIVFISDPNIDTTFQLSFKVYDCTSERVLFEHKIKNDLNYPDSYVFESVKLAFIGNGVFTTTIKYTDESDESLIYELYTDDDCNVLVHFHFKSTSGLFYNKLNAKLFINDHNCISARDAFTGSHIMTTLPFIRKPSRYDVKALSENLFAMRSCDAKSMVICNILNSRNNIVDIKYFDYNITLLDNWLIFISKRHFLVLPGQPRPSKIKIYEIRDDDIVDYCEMKYIGGVTRSIQLPDDTIFINSLHYSIGKYTINSNFRKYEWIQKYKFPHDDEFIDDDSLEIPRGYKEDEYRYLESLEKCILIKSSSIDIKEYKYEIFKCLALPRVLYLIVLNYIHVLCDN